MANPFPGMNPFLEDPVFWEEFHYLLIAESLYHLADRLPQSYIARIQERVQSISISDEAAKLYIPDISIAQKRSRVPARSLAGEGGTAVLTRPITIASTDDLEIREGYIEILRLPKHELVTSIEVLSPANKVGEGAAMHRAKRRTLVARGVHVVEIDLLIRGGHEQLAEPLPPGDYFAMTFRGDRRPDVDVYPWSLRDPLPPIPIPLKGPDEAVNLLLAQAFAATFDRNRYDAKLEYQSPYPVTISPAQIPWVEEILRAAGKR